MKEALLYKKLEPGAVACYLCNHHCRITEGHFGFCGVRQNIKGVLYTYTFGKPVALHVDPVEKKPLYHFLPGSSSFSLATIGCNFRCGFCQNWEISQAKISDAASEESREIPASTIVAQALRNECQSISYTYTEPTIFFEYAQDIARAAKEKALKNIFVTNGFMTPECLGMSKPWLDAANVDLKFFKEESYKNICGASLGPVLESIKIMKEMGVWVEITTLVVPGENDSEEELTAIAEFIASVDVNMPWHISRFHPDYEMGDTRSTPEETLRIAQSIGDTVGLNYVYAGNVFGWGNDTHCPSCKKPVIKREVFDVLEYNIENAACGFCKTRIPGVF